MRQANKRTNEKGNDDDDDAGNEVVVDGAVVVVRSLLHAEFDGMWIL